MAEVTVNINGREYGISCDEGQEERVAALGQFVDEKVNNMAAAGAATNDTQLLVLTSILISDELFDLRQQMQTAQPAFSDYAQNTIANENEISQKIDALAMRLNGLADKVLAG